MAYRLYPLLVGSDAGGAAQWTACSRRRSDVSRQAVDRADEPRRRGDPRSPRRTEDVGGGAGPRPAVPDAGGFFGGGGAPADPAEIMLTARASSIAATALSRIGQRDSAGDVVAAVDEDARRNGAEEVYVAMAPDLARDQRLLRVEGEPALGRRFSVRASVAYKGSWVRRVVTIDPDGTVAG